MHGKDAVAKIPTHHHDSLCLGLKSLKWRLWHGQYQRAVRKLTEFLAILRRPTISSKKVTRRMRRLAKKLFDYLKNNENSLMAALDGIGRALAVELIPTICQRTGRMAGPAKVLLSRGIHGVLPAISIVASGRPFAIVSRVRRVAGKRGAVRGATIGLTTFIIQQCAHLRKDAIDREWFVHERCALCEHGAPADHVPNVAR